MQATYSGHNWHGRARACALQQALAYASREGDGLEVALRVTLPMCNAGCNMLAWQGTGVQRSPVYCTGGGTSVQDPRVQRDKLAWV
jgi:hypothetical protein